MSSSDESSAGPQSSMDLGSATILAAASHSGVGDDCAGGYHYRSMAGDRFLLVAGGEVSG